MSNRTLADYPGHLILLHPNIPRPLHGLTPRELRGKEWWDARRQQAYAQFNYHCWACGVHKSQARFHHWLEAHECYITDYAKAVSTYIGVSALCHCCHNYIHDGRLQILHSRRRITTPYYHAVISHGNAVLARNGISFRKKVDHPIMVPYRDNPFIVSGSEPVIQAGWSDWKLVIGKQTYTSRFKSEEEWRRYYQ